MPARLNLFSANKAVSAFRQPPIATFAPRTSVLPLRTRVQQSTSVQKRWNSSKDEPKNFPPEEQAYPSQDPLPHVSEEAAEIDRIMNNEKSCDGQPSSPELEQGTPVSEILQRDKKGMKHMPKVMQDQFKKGGSRSFSTSVRSRLPDVEGLQQPQDDGSAAVLANMIQQVKEQAVEKQPGLNFDAPEVAAKTLNFRKRYDSLQEQFTKMLMQDGKLARAQSVSSVLHEPSHGQLGLYELSLEYVYNP